MQPDGDSCQGPYNWQGKLKPTSPVHKSPETKIRASQSVRKKSNYPMSENVKRSLMSQNQEQENNGASMLRSSSACGYVENSGRKEVSRLPIQQRANSTLGFTDDNGKTDQYQETKVPSKVHSKIMSQKGKNDQEHTRSVSDGYHPKKVDGAKVQAKSQLKTNGNEPHRAKSDPGQRPIVVDGANEQQSKVPVILRKEKTDKIRFQRELKLKRDQAEQRQRGPMVAKSKVQSQHKTGAVANATNSLHPTKARKSFLDVPQSESAFTRQVVNTPILSSIPRHPQQNQARAAVAPGSDRRGSQREIPVLMRTKLAGQGSSEEGNEPEPSNSSKRPVTNGLSVESVAAGPSDGIPVRRVSPNQNSQLAESEAVISNRAKRVEKVMKTRLFFLSQIGPSSFLIGGDSPNHKYRVNIGSQTCNCNKGPHCVHILFMMLRVFHIEKQDPSLWAKSLKKYEADTLLDSFQKKRLFKVRENKRKSGETKDFQREESLDGEIEDDAELSVEASKEDSIEEEECPICLLEMLEGESLTECLTCENKYHQHCISIWFTECRQQKEPLICPLCRDPWKTEGEEENDGMSDMGQDSSDSSSVLAHLDYDPLPHVEPISEEYEELASTWIPVLREEVVACIFSKDWMARESGLKHMSRAAVASLLLGVGEGRHGAVVSPSRCLATNSMLECCFDVLAYTSKDPVYRVYVAALRVLRSVLAYVPCRLESQQMRLQTLLGPVIDTLLLKCADSNKRTSQLSISALQEFLKGRDGELAVGKEILNGDTYDLGNLNYLLSRILQEYEPEEAKWQWLLGRLIMLDKLVDEHPIDFLSHPVNLHPNSDPQVLQNYERVMKVLAFLAKALNHVHHKVSKMSKAAFLQLSRLQRRYKLVMKNISALLEEVPLSTQINMNRKLLKITQEQYGSHKLMQMRKQEITSFDHPEDNVFQSESPLPNTPNHSPYSTPRTISPTSSETDTIHSTIEPPAIVVDNLVTVGGSNINFVSIVPPNTPVKDKTRKISRHSSYPGDNYQEQQMENNNLKLDETIGFNLNDDSSSQGISSASVSPRESLDTEDTNRSSTSPGDIVSDFSESNSLSPRKPDLNVASSSEDIPSRIMTRQDAMIFAEKEEVPPTAGPLRPTGLPGLVSVQTDSLDSHVLHVSSASEDDFGMGIDNMEEEEEDPDEDVLDGLLKDVPETLSDDAEEENSGDQNSPNADPEQIFSSSGNSSIPANNSRDYSLLDNTDDVMFSPVQGLSFSKELKSPQGGSAFAEAVLADNKETEQEVCACKEEVEREEAQALIAAIEKSEQFESVLPFVPGLSTLNTSLVRIRIQEDVSDLQPRLEPSQSSPSPDRPAEGNELPHYFENVDWKRGPIIGKGGFSTCYQARDIKTGTIMAVKQMSYCRNSSDDETKVFKSVKEEIDLMYKLHHPNVVRLLGATQQEGFFFVFVEWMPGGSVAALLQLYGAFEQDVIIRYTQQILRGLAYMHENGFLHRDLKGGNLLVDSTGQTVKLGDFGTSARLAGPNTELQEFQGEIKGTVAYMAPEVCRGEHYGRRCDVWSVGCVIIEMATTKPPWITGHTSNYLQLLFKIASATECPRIPENFMPPLRDLTLRCLELCRDDRPPAKDLLTHPLFTRCNSKK